MGVNRTGMKNSTDHDIVQSLPVVGPEQVLLRIVHEVDRWEVVGPDADKAHAEIRD